MKTPLLLLVWLALAFSLSATPADDKEAERQLMLLRAQKRAEQLATQDRLTVVGAKIGPVKARLASDAFTGIFRVVQVVPSGLLVAPVQVHCGLSMVTTAKRTMMVQGTGLDSHKQIPREIIEEIFAPPADFPTSLFLSCDNTGLFESQRITRTIWRTGTHTYTSVLHASTTVAAYTTDSALASR
jgi:hypothetical protein